MCGDVHVSSYDTNRYQNMKKCSSCDKMLLGSLESCHSPENKSNKFSVWIVRELDSNKESKRFVNVLIPKCTTLFEFSWQIEDSLPCRTRPFLSDSFLIVSYRDLVRRIRDWRQKKRLLPLSVYFMANHVILMVNPRILVFWMTFKSPCLYVYSNYSN